MKNDNGELQMAQRVLGLTENEVENDSNWFQTENNSDGHWRNNKCGVL